MVFMPKTTPDYPNQVLDRWTMERQNEVTSIVIFFIMLNCLASGATKDLKPCCAAEKTNTVKTESQKMLNIQHEKQMFT